MEKPLSVNDIRVVEQHLLEQKIIIPLDGCTPEQLAEFLEDLDDLAEKL